jgi:hypothetical protein
MMLRTVVLLAIVYVARKTNFLILPVNIMHYDGNVTSDNVDRNNDYETR